jgi:hypothetical protein
MDLVGNDSGSFQLFGTFLNFRKDFFINAILTQPDLVSEIVRHHYNKIKPICYKVVEKIIRSCFFSVNTIKQIKFFVQELEELLGFSIFPSTYPEIDKSGIGLVGSNGAYWIAY